MTHQKIKEAFDYFYASNHIDYEAKTHRYILDGITMAGVSSVSDYSPKPFLAPWAAKMVVEYLEDKQEIIKTLSPKEYLELLLEAKKTHKRKSEEALEIGTQCHQFCEDWILGKKPVITEEIKNPAEQFIEFEKNHKVAWVCVEKIVCSPTHLVAGRIDSLAFVDDKLSLVDLKTSSRISEGYFLQTAGYQMCLQEMGIPIEQRIILRLPKTKDDGFEAVLVDTDYEADKKAFIAQREAYGWHNYISCKHTDKIKRPGYVEEKLKLIKL